MTRPQWRPYPERCAATLRGESQRTGTPSFPHLETFHA
jgi:hypothetical protein